MRTLAIYAVAVTLVAGLFAVHDSRLQHRVAALEQQLAASARPAPAAARSVSSRKWTASNGVTFSGADLERLNDEAREAKQRAAEIEYVWTH